MEEVGIEVKKYELFDSDSVAFEWNYKEDIIVKVHHTGIFYKVLDYNNDIKKDVIIDDVNDDSLGADFYEVSSLTKNELSAIAVMELEKLGYKLK